METKHSTPQAVERAVAQRNLAFERTLQDRFEEFHDDNPDVYRELVRRCADVIDRWPGAKFGLQVVYEAMRYSSLKTTGDAFKLNNDWVSRYSRLIVKEYPAWKRNIRTRDLKTP